MPWNPWLMCCIRCWADEKGNLDRIRGISYYYSGFVCAEVKRTKVRYFIKNFYDSN